MSDVSENPASAQLTEADIALFREIGTSRNVHEGEYLYREGDISYDFFVVVSAEVDIIVRADAADHVVGHHGAGRFLDAGFSARTVATSTGVLMLIPATILALALRAGRSRQESAVS